MKSHSSNDASLADRLADLDDRLREGRAVEPPQTTELHAGDSTEIQGLLECIQALEDRWPRGTGKSDESVEPSSVGMDMHPSLALATGQAAPRFGKFIIERELGRGGFGVVYLATDTVLGRQVALKIPRPELLFDADARQRFLREAKAAAALDHPYVTPVYEAGEVGPWCFIASAVCPGPTLAELLAKRQASLPPRLAARLAERLSSALTYVHQRGILHRDLKPANVLLWPSTEPASDDELPFLPRLTDFGLAKVVEESLADTRSSLLLGTPLYMAPEQAEGGLHDVGEHTDVYALGAILYETLTGQPPFSGSNLVNVIDQVRHAEPSSPRKLNAHVPRELEIICLRCLQKRPEDRYPNAALLGDDLRRFLKGEEIAARPVTPLKRLLRWSQRPQRLRDAGLTVVAVNLAAGGWVMFTAMVLAWGIVPRPGNMTAADVYQHTLPLIVLVVPALIAAGLGIAAGRRWAVQLALGTGLGQTVVAILLSLNFLHNPYSGLWNDLPGLSMLMYSMMAMLYLLQSIASAVAWIALKRQSRDTRVPPNGDSREGVQLPERVVSIVASIRLQDAKRSQRRLDESLGL
jgi:serine/threonine protein kinase